MCVCLRFLHVTRKENDLRCTTQTFRDNTRGHICDTLEVCARMCVQLRLCACAHIKKNLHRTTQTSRDNTRGRKCDTLDVGKDP